VEEKLYNVASFQPIWVLFPHFRLPSNISTIQIQAKMVKIETFAVEQVGTHLPKRKMASC
jgi:hypothetical protein